MSHDIQTSPITPPPRTPQRPTLGLTRRLRRENAMTTISVRTFRSRPRILDFDNLLNFSSPTRSESKKRSRSEFEEEALNIPQQSAEKDTHCPICLDTEEESESKFVITHCNHFYHADCIFKWYFSSGTNNCPLCKSVLKPAKNAKIDNPKTSS